MTLYDLCHPTEEITLRLTLQSMWTPVPSPLARLNHPPIPALTQTSPATAHLAACPRAAAASWLARNRAASNQVPEFTLQNPKAPGFLGHFCGSYSRYWCPAKLCKRPPGQLALDTLCERDVVEYYLLVPISWL